MGCKTLIMTVGLPRSGKSTWANSEIYPIVNPDAIRLALHGQRFVKESEPMVWALARYMVEALFIAGHNIVILDATNTTKTRRSEWISRKWKRVFEIIPTTAETCIERANNAEDFYIIPIIEKMRDQYEEVTQDELLSWEV